MIFGEAIYYFLFLLPNVLAFHLSPRWIRPWLIVFTGIVFFCYFGSVYFGGAIGALAVLILLWELLTSRLYKTRSRWCIFGVVQAILILSYFKYSKFLAGAWRDVADSPSLFEVNGWLSPVLPLGISFFTFEFIHFAVDRYKGKIARNSLSDYAAFIFFFPTMVAGPIKRFEDFASELNKARFDGEQFSRGITRILVGLAKKHILADTFAVAAARLNTETFQGANRYSVVMWILAYGMKIYFDFSAYSDIAIGSAQLFGIKVPENFNWPYFSQNVSEFWRRWHISFGRWIYDYVYFSRKGSRGGAIRMVAALLLAFGISGLWHGAAYNFVAFGLCHGILVVIHRIWVRFSSSANISMPKLASIALTFIMVNLAWPLFGMKIESAIKAYRILLGIA